MVSVTSTPLPRARCRIPSMSRSSALTSVGRGSNAWRRAIAKSGIVKDSRIGYSTGLNYPPDWGEHTISLRPGDMTVLEPNMTIHCIGGIWEDDWGVEISECFRITETGSATFCDFPRKLFIKE